MLKDIRKLGSVISKEQQSKILGGVLFHCLCTNHAGSWIGNYSSLTQALNSLNLYCSNGEGNCYNNEDESLEVPN